MYPKLKTRIKVEWDKMIKNLSKNNEKNQIKSGKGAVFN
jgi:hypothetical protein